MNNRRQPIHDNAASAVLGALALPSFALALRLTQVKIINGFPVCGSAKTTCRSVGEKLNRLAHTKKSRCGRKNGLVFRSWPKYVPTSSHQPRRQSTQHRKKNRALRARPVRACCPSAEPPHKWWLTKKCSLTRRARLSRKSALLPRPDSPATRSAVAAHKTVATVIASYCESTGLQSPTGDFAVHLAVHQARGSKRAVASRLFGSAIDQAQPGHRIAPVVQRAQPAAVRPFLQNWHGVKE